MRQQQAEVSWRWRDAGVAAVIWFVPVTGLAGASSLITTDRVLASLLIALLVGTVMSVPLPALQARVVKTASARRISESVWTAAAAAAVLALLELDGRSLVSAAVGLVCLWAALAISVALRPLAVAPAGLRTERLQWLPIPRRSPVAVAGKRAFDAVVSAIALLAIAPVLAVVAIAIKAHDGGPVLFKQRRVGQNGVPFEMLKFRSMVLNAEELRAELEAESDRNGPLFKMTNDPRITPVGRIIRELSIDELPQLVNIVRGDMSLVGPRPALPDEEAQFDNTLQRRNLVTPGLTGLWQAEARSDADFERFRELDLRYVSAASPSLDLWIILATATDVFLAVAALPLGLFGVELVKNDGIDLTDQASDSVIDLRSADGSPSPRPSAA